MTIRQPDEIVAGFEADTAPCEEFLEWLEAMEELGGELGCQETENLHGWDVSEVFDARFD